MKFMALISLALAFSNLDEWKMALNEMRQEQKLGAFCYDPVLSNYAQEKSSQIARNSLLVANPRLVEILNYRQHRAKTAHEILVETETESVEEFANQLDENQKSLLTQAPNHIGIARSQFRNGPKYFWVLVISDSDNANCLMTKSDDSSCTFNSETDQKLIELVTKAFTALNGTASFDQIIDQLINLK